MRQRGGAGTQLSVTLGSSAVGGGEGGVGGEGGRGDGGVSLQFIANETIQRVEKMVSATVDRKAKESEQRMSNALSDVATTLREEPRAERAERVTEREMFDERLKDLE